jgi:diphthamide biosynthesis protein 4
MATSTVHPASGKANAKKKTKQRPPTHYEILQIPPVADVATIKAAYHKAALLYHPDKRRRAPHAQAQLAITNDDINNKDDDDDSQFQKIQVAWECLRHVEQRQVYDEELWLRSKQQSNRQASSIPLERSDCREEYLESVGDYTLIYTCRCGQDVDTAEVDADSDDDDDDDALTGDKDLVTCPGCCFVYDTSPLWRDEEEAEG